ncbi:MAG: TonB-dependent receptor [Prolixibacteraceae bacterium]|nr:TonB-dependent receptor [Prolixibacteraceae bacterium]
MKRVIVLLLIFLTVYSYANPIKGKVLGLENGAKNILPGANIYWAGTNLGTIANENGEYSIQSIQDNNLLVFSFVGFKTDTIKWSGQKVIDAVLDMNMDLDEVTVVQRKKGTHISRLNPIYTTQINGAELHKAACCNLSESFSTNPSVDVSYSDAITGAKQIKLLGLDGTYSQLQTENFPNLRGLATNYGLTYIPGPWLESIQVSKGAASVLNGYESITGQINANFKKTDGIEAFHFNVFASAEGRTEVNSNFAVKLSEKTSTAFFVHHYNFQNRIDENMDGFLDEPLMKQIHLFNQWKYDSGTGFMVHSGIHYLNEDRVGGQANFRKDMERNTLNPYGVNVQNERFEGYVKGGYDFKGSRHSLAFISNFTYHEMGSYYGLNNYSGKEYTMYGNLVHTFSIDPMNVHSLNSGASIIVDQADEILNQNSINTNDFVPGVFSEYTFKPNPKITLMAGLRADFHNTFGTFVTPRVHLRYGPNELLTFRVSAGKGYRSPRILAENSFLLANSRSLNFTENKILEEAWNYGASVNLKIPWTERPLNLNAEYFRTDFINQLVVDRESSASQILLTALDGQSFANSYQLELLYELLPRLDITAAYRVNDVRQTINHELVRKPLVSKYKGLVTINYTDRLKKWMFDYNAQLNGGGRLPIVVDSQLNSPTEFPSFTVMNAQVTRYFRYWNLYVGAENLLNYTQDHPVLDAERPFGNEFDATRIWGPVMGRRIYAGIRITLNHKTK